MLFHSQEFLLLFLPAALIAWALSERSAKAREWVLIAASVIFYAAWDMRFLPLILGQTLIAWAAARAYFATSARLWISLAIVAELAAIGVFKYLDFLAGALSALTGAEFAEFSLILPIGVSFYTFQTISYLVDVKRGQAPDYPLRRFLVYILFFPQLIAGPIVRHHELIPQLDAIRPLRERLEQPAMGAILFVIGVAKKVFLADPIARIVDPIYAAAAHGAPSFGEAWTAALGFTAQLLLDFASYTDMAIGLALIFGLVLPQNFDAPYRAVGLRDFWRRWHMTLSRFLRDYVYIPLGGSRHGAAVAAFATLATMTLCGLWHGAGWTFVAWGALHGVGLLVDRAWSGAGLPMPRALGWAITMLFVIAGWVLFRAVDFASAEALLGAMIGGHGFGGRFDDSGLIVSALALLLLAPTSLRAAEALARPAWPVAAAIGLLLWAALLEVGRGEAINFVYFQF